MLKNLKVFHVGQYPLRHVEAAPHGLMLLARSALKQGELENTNYMLLESFKLLLRTIEARDEQHIHRLLALVGTILHVKLVGVAVDTHDHDVDAHIFG